MMPIKGPAPEVVSGSEEVEVGAGGVEDAFSPAQEAALTNGHDEVVAAVDGNYPSVRRAR